MISVIIMYIAISVVMSAFMWVIGAGEGSL